MIVLDATNKSLKMDVSGTNPGMTSVVTYWSIDSSNVWTPRSFEIAITASSGSSDVILPAPSAGETKVVENVWINLLNSMPTGVMSVFVLVGSAKHNLFEINGATGVGAGDQTTYTLARDGSFSRQDGSFQASALSHNVH